jgi:FlaG/FlaF family flagellin (archaellin)
MTGRNLKSGSFKKDEDAVSPVIGVILMVAITAILDRVMKIIHI